MSSNASIYIKAVAAALKSELGLKSSEIHGGSFNLAEVKSVAVNSPCAFVALLDLPDSVDKTCRHDSSALSPVVFLFTEGRDRNTDIIDLASKAKAFIKGNRFDQDFATAAIDVVAKNLYTKELGELNIGAWVLNFNTTIS